MCRRALSGITRVYVYGLESDLARMVAALETNQADRSELRWTILETKKKHLQMLLDWKIMKVRRESNKVAHELARLARRNFHTAT